MSDYTTAERRGRESLRRFLLDLDAKETSAIEAQTIGGVLELYLALDAHPRLHHPRRPRRRPKRHEGPSHRRPSLLQEPGEKWGLK
jgi:hypothetical protein